MKKKMTIIGVICIILLIVLFVINHYDQKSYFKELNYNKLMEKIDNRDTFVLMLSQTTCSHCMDFKPKIESVANEYKLYIYYIEVNLLNSEQVSNLKQIISYDGTPTTVFITDGMEKTAANRLNGSVSKETLIEKLKSNGFIN